MSRVIFFSYPLFGHVNYGLKLAKKLLDIGEDVYYYSGIEYKSLIEGKGVKFCLYNNIDKIIKDHAEVLVNDGLETLWSTGCHFLEIYNDLVNNDFEELLKINPDYIIYDAIAVWGNGIAKKLNIPVISSVTSYAFNEEMIKKDPDCVIRNILNMEGSSYFEGDKYRILKRTLDQFSKNLNKLYNRNDYYITHNFYGREKLNLIYSTKGFQKHYELFDESNVFIGPLIDDDDLNIDVSDFLMPNRKKIYISMGTIYNDNIEFYKKCINVFRDTQYQVIMSIGNKISSEQLGDIPENFVVKNFLPQIVLMGKIDLFISHGGANSIREAIDFGVPTIIIPQGGDQLIVAEDVERLELGIYVRDDNEVNLNKLADTIFQNEKIKINCERMSKEMKDAGGIEKAVAEILKYKIVNNII